MSFDMSQFYRIFFEEAEEHLATIERLLLGIDPAAPDGEQVAEIFRAAHSIKGSAATFGFDDLAALTHEIESLLDDVRRGRQPLTHEIIEACLAGSDVLHNLLAAHRGEARPDRDAAERARLRLADLREALAAGRMPPAAATFAPPPVIAPVAVEPFRDARPGARSRYRVSLRLARFLVGHPALYESMLEDLADIGALEVLDEDADGDWLLQIDTALPPSALRAACERIAEPGSLRIEAEPAATGAEPADDPVFDGAADGSYGFFAPLPAAAAPAAPPSPRLVEAPAPAAEPPRSAADGSIRVGVERVDQMMDLIGELVITQAMLADAAAALGEAAGDRLLGGLALLQRHTRELQHAVMAVRMVPVAMVFSRFPRLVHDLGPRLGKEIELVREGEQTELDKGMVEKLIDPLTHLVRNCIDHGIETPAQRLAAGKPAAGRLRLAASHRGGHVVIEVEDDGAGMDRERLLAQARRQGLACSDGMSDEEVWQLIFVPGFSTAAEVTELSGRGVGMDVVRRNIAALGGSLTIASQPGRGTRFTVRVPLTLAILDGMLAGVGEEVFVLPIDGVLESLQASADMLHSLGGAPRMIAVRGDYWPVVELHRLFEVPGAGTDWCRGIMVLVERNGCRAALFVDALLGQQQVVIKRLETHFRRVAGVSSATLLGDGRVALILDLDALTGSSAQGGQHAR